MSRRGIITEALNEVKKNTVSQNYVSKNLSIVAKVLLRLSELGRDEKWLDEQTGYNGVYYRFTGRYDFTLRELVAIEECLDLQLVKK